MPIKKVGVLGCGLMGSGIAQVASQAGYDTTVVEVEQKFLDKGISGIEKSGFTCCFSPSPSSSSNSGLSWAE